MVLPGLTPRSPVMTVAPVLVTVDPPSTPKFAAVPKFTLAALTPIAQQNTTATVSIVFRDVMNSVFIMKDSFYSFKLVQKTELFYGV